MAEMNSTKMKQAWGAEVKALHERATTAEAALVTETQRAEEREGALKALLAMAKAEHAQDHEDLEKVAADLAMAQETLRKVSDAWLSSATQQEFWDKFSEDGDDLWGEVAQHVPCALGGRP